MNQQQIDTVLLKLKYGEHVILQKKNGKHHIISPFKDRDGDYRSSGYHDTIEKAKMYIGALVPLNLEDALRSSTYIDSFIIEYPLVPVGTRVKFRPVEEVKRLCRERGVLWVDDKADLVKAKYATIGEMEVNCYKLVGSQVDCKYCFPREAFTIAMPEEDDKLSGLTEVHNNNLIAELQRRMIAKTSK